MSEQPIRYVVRFCGHVQNVGFRANAISESDGLLVYGTVRNEVDGSVRMDVEGPKADLDELIRRIQSSMRDNLSDTMIDELPPLGRSDGFKIAY